MKFETTTSMTQILDALFEVYANRVPDVKKITAAMVQKNGSKSKMKSSMTTLLFVLWVYLI